MMPTETSQGMDPDMMSAVLNLQDNQNDPQAIQLARKQAMVNQMRGIAMTAPEGQMVGRTYIKSSPLASLNQVMAGAMAGHDQNGVDQGMDALQKQRTNAKMGYANALAKGLRRPVAPGQGSDIGPMGAGADTMPQGLNIMADGSTPQAGY